MSVLTHATEQLLVHAIVPTKEVCEACGLEESNLAITTVVFCALSLQVLIQMDCFLLSGQVEKQKLLQDWKDIWRERYVAEIHHT